MSDPNKKILEEEIMGGIPAIALLEKGFAQCGLVFATNIIIIAYFTSKLLQTASAIRTPNYHIMKNAWDGFQHKPAAKILNDKQYKNYIIPYSEITLIGAKETGRIRKRTLLNIHTKERVFTFKCMTGKKTLDRDVSDLLRQCGVGFSKENATPAK